MSDPYEKISTESGDEVRLIFACSGGADVGHLSDLAARQMMKEGCSKMFCLAGIGGKVSTILDTTRNADKTLVIDGCSVDCAKKTFDDAGMTDYHHFRVTDLGFEKGKSPVDDKSVTQISEHGKALW